MSDATPETALRQGIAVIRPTPYPTAIRSPVASRGPWRADPGCDAMGQVAHERGQGNDGDEPLRSGSSVPQGVMDVGDRRFQPRRDRR